jgi:hypothetical protein
VDFKILLPLMSLAFLDFWLRLCEKFMVTLKVYDEVCNLEGIRITINCTYNYKNSVSFKLVELKGPFGKNPELTCLLQNNKEKSYAYPEQFSTSLSPTQKAVTIKIKSQFKQDYKPDFKFCKNELYIIKLLFKIDNSNRRKRVYCWIRREE